MTQRRRNSNTQNPELHHRVSETEREIGEMTSTMKSLIRTVDTLAQNVDSLRDKLSSSGRPDWAVLLLAIGALAAFIVLHTNPIKEQARQNHVLLMERLKQLPADYEQFGRNSSLIQHTHELATFAENKAVLNAENVERHEQWLKDLEIWLQAVDQGGSRKWIGSSGKE